MKLALAIRSSGPGGCGHFAGFRFSGSPNRQTQLAGELIRQGALPQKATVDAFHIGIAADHQIDYLLTWNCKHLANATMRSTIEAICRSSDLGPPIICTPEELPSGSAP